MCVSVCLKVCPLRWWPHSKLSVTPLLCSPAVLMLACLSLTHSKELDTQTPAESQRTAAGGELQAMFEGCLNILDSNHLTELH